jgi:hypothetical protein
MRRWFRPRSVLSALLAASVGCDSNPGGPATPSAPSASSNGAVQEKGATKVIGGNRGRDAMIKTMEPRGAAD